MKTRIPGTDSFLTLRGGSVAVQQDNDTIIWDARELKAAITALTIAHKCMVAAERAETRRKK